MSVSPSLFLRVNAKIAPAFLTASFRSAASDVRRLWIMSKAAEDGRASIRTLLAQAQLNWDYAAANRS